MEKLIEDMHQCDRSVVSAVEKIRNISTNTAELTVKMADCLTEQLDGIRNAAKRVNHLSAVSEEMEQALTKFKL